MPGTVTIPVARVLSALLDDPQADHYGLDLMTRAQLPSGTLYPILRRLERAGVIVGRWEDGDAGALGRPRRRYYSLTAEGAAHARLQLAQLDAVARGRRRGIGPARGLAGGTT